jgi:hypothetical protein
MKTYLLIATLFTIIAAGCNNNAKNTDADSPKKDSIVSTLTDLSASTDIKKLLCQNWENKEDAEDAALSGGGDGLELIYRGFSFFEDGSVVENPRDNIKFGKWTLDEASKTINIEYNKGGKSQYKIVAIGAKQMILMKQGDEKKVEYKADAKMQQNPADDPFHASNNQWRIKPVKPESDSAIKQRTEQCVLFYSKFLADNANRGGNIISFVGFPTCFKWYRGGVSIKSAETLEEKWINCYYNKAQAMKAYAMLDEIIGKKYKWNKEEANWVKQSADVVRQMYDTLRLL